MKKIHLAAIQQHMSEQASENFARSTDLVRQAAANGAELILLPELHFSRYFCQTANPEFFDLAQPIPGDHSQALAALSAELKIILVGSLFEKSLPGVYFNTAVVFDHGQLIGKYRKMHIPDDPGYYEKFYFTPGDLGFTPLETRLGKLGVLVCWDQWFPEAARLMALAGAEILLYPTAIGFDPADPPEAQARQREAWLTIQRSHAIANGCVVVAANRVGFEPDPSQQTLGAEFWGGSFIAGPQGEILAQGDFQPGVVSAQVDLLQNEKIRRLWPYLRDRRIDAYGELLKRVRT
jgi:N-carbamoylputrescine amidase